MSDEKLKNLRFIVPVENIPGLKNNETTLYSEIINEFLTSNIKYAEVTLTDKNPTEFIMA